MRARNKATIIICMDYFTHYSFIFFISHEYKTLSCFIKYMNLVENQLDKKIKASRIYR